ncbi:hypothetical protein NL676_036418 [Syzygium grande]|nr:hypothetical protein NL676_036418 [Syzygium grande]
MCSEGVGTSRALMAGHFWMAFLVLVVGGCIHESAFGWPAVGQQVIAVSAWIDPRSNFEGPPFEIERGSMVDSELCHVSFLLFSLRLWDCVAHQQYGST